MAFEEVLQEAQRKRIRVLVAGGLFNAPPGHNMHAEAQYALSLMDDGYMPILPATITDSLHSRFPQPVEALVGYQVSLLALTDVVLLRGAPSIMREVLARTAARHGIPVLQDLEELRESHPSHNPSVGVQFTIGSDWWEGPDARELTADEFQKVEEFEELAARVMAAKLAPGYVLGPYSRDGSLGTYAAMALGTLLLGRVAPFIPHHSHQIDMILRQDYHTWLAIDGTFLDRCDWAARIPGPSSGADDEQKVLEEEFGVTVETELSTFLDSLPKNNLFPVDTELALRGLERYIARVSGDPKVWPPRL
ncbi:MAG: hypothetical protein KDD64_08740 [Bdellovibrionales bacterium]|nr:hypothetical protein [Bdellovibrionales bacterium]